MKRLSIIIAVMLMFVSCAKAPEVLGPSGDINNGDASTSQMVDDAYYLTGELVEIDGNRYLVDSVEAGLVWVSFDNLPEIEVKERSIIKVLFGGDIAESYPGQTSGISIEVVEPFDEAFVMTYEEMNVLLGDGDVNHVIEWNTLKDYVAYAQIDLSNTSKAYFVRIANLYNKEIKLVAYVEGELPDLAWFYETLQIQTSDEFQDVPPPYETIDLEGDGLGGITDEEKVEDKSEAILDYDLTLQQFKNEHNGSVIEYYQMSGLLGELVNDYINQSLMKATEVYNTEDIVGVVARTYVYGNYLTIEYGIEKEAYSYVQYLVLHVPSGTIVTMDNLIKDKALFADIFEEKTTYSYATLEGVTPYFNGQGLVLTFVPTDDSATREFHVFTMDELVDVLETEYEMPAS